MVKKAKKKGDAAASSAPKTKAKSSAKNKQKPAPEDEDEPVLSGRMIVALALALAMLVIPQYKPLRDKITKTAPRTTAKANWKVGQTAHLHLTVVTADYAQMACADTRKFGESHCEYENERERWPREEGKPVDDNKLHTLQPYRTTDKNLLLLPGLWAQPEVAMRVHSEPSHGVSHKKLARFVVDCEVKFHEKWQNAVVRWKPSEKWSNQGEAWVGEVLSCRILEDGTS